MRGRRREAQPSGIKTFGSTFKNPDAAEAGGRTAGQLLEAAGCRGLRRGGARFAEKHANFVENTGEASTADVLALMAEGRARVKQRFDVLLEPEVQVLGPGRVARRLGGRVSALAHAIARVRPAGEAPLPSAARVAAPGAPSPPSRRSSLPSGYWFWLRDSGLVAVNKVEGRGDPGRIARWHRSSSGPSSGRGGR